MANLDLTGYKLTFSDEFNTRSISATGEGTTWADMRSEWVMSDGKAEVGFGNSSFVDPSSTKTYVNGQHYDGNCVSGDATQGPIVSGGPFWIVGCPLNP